MERLKHYVINNGIFVPRGIISDQDIVYDENREIVRESCILRGNNKSENITNAPKYLPREIATDIKSIDERLLFMGQFMREHYGHFLTEGVSRYWYLLDNPDENWKIPTPQNPFGLKKIGKSIIKPGLSHWKKVMLVFNIKSSDILHIKKPIRAKEVIVPQCSMYNRYKVYPKHLDVTRKIARHILGTAKLQQDIRPVYLSRTKLNKSMSSYIGEEPTEEYCKNIGCKIVYPERLSLKEQVVLINTHNVFIGCIGSAFHSLLFRFVEKNPTNIYLTTEPTEPTEPTKSNYAMIDSVLRSKTHYIHCLKSVANKKKTNIFDSQKAISELSEILKNSNN